MFRKFTIDVGSACHISVRVCDMKCMPLNYKLHIEILFAWISCKYVSCFSLYVILYFFYFFTIPLLTIVKIKSWKNFNKLSHCTVKILLFLFKASFHRGELCKITYLVSFDLQLRECLKYRVVILYA